MFLDPRVPARIWAKLTPEPNTGCWLWHGDKNLKLNVGGRPRHVRGLIYRALLGEPERTRLIQVCGLHGCCNPLHRRVATRAHNLARQRNAQRRWTSNNKAKVRASALRRNFGIGPEEVEAMRVAQSNACAICRQPFSRTPHVDHCHKTGVVRGLLCTRCNMGIGLFDDDPTRMVMAAAYVGGR